MVPLAIGCRGYGCGFFESVDRRASGVPSFFATGVALLGIRLGSPLFMAERFAWYRRIKDDFPNRGISDMQSHNRGSDDNTTTLSTRITREGSCIFCPFVRLTSYSSLAFTWAV